MTVAPVVVVPWRAGCPRRERVWGWLRARLEGLGWSVTVGGSPDGPWVKAQAVMPAVVAAPPGSVVVVHDADAWCDGLVGAVAAVEDGARWAVPHTLVRRLDEQATSLVLDGCPLDRGLAAEQAPYEGVMAGGIVVARRELFLDVPPSLAFRGWGGEDHAWGWALETLVGPPWRGHDDLWHLWHPPQPRMTRKIGCMESERLRRLYFANRCSPAGMRALVEAGKPAGGWGSCSP